jgi:hypothetical protein
MWPIYSPVLLRNLVSVLLAEFPLENVVFLRLQPLHRCKFERNKLTMRRKLEFSIDLDNLPEIFLRSRNCIIKVYGS